jgi:ribonuclease G
MPRIQPRILTAPAPVPKTLIVNRISSEIRVAVMERDRLVELWVERGGDRSAVGNLYLGRVAAILPGTQSAFVGIGLRRAALLHFADLPEGADDDTPIESRLEVGQTLLVQLRKEPLPGKGARVSARPSLAGRLVVLLPGEDRVAVSRKIVDPECRKRLQATAARHLPAGFGLIVRTGSVDASPDAIVAEVRRLGETWAEIRRRSESAAPGEMLHREPDLVTRLLRDGYAAGGDRIVVDDHVLFEACVAGVERARLSPAASVEWHQGEPIFDRFGVEREIGRLLRPRVWLPSGGYLVIQPTEALVAIDVNTGKYIGREGPEETALRINREAASEVARQLRLRDLSGIVVVDFIGMRDEVSRRDLLDHLERDLSRDRARTRILPISEFGLVEITRQRTRHGLERVLRTSCPTCRGSGRLRKPVTSFHDLERAIQRLGPHLEPGRIRIRAHPALAGLIADRRRAVMEGLPRGKSIAVEVVADPCLPFDRFAITNLPTALPAPRSAQGSGPLEAGEGEPDRC